MYRVSRFLTLTALDREYELTVELGGLLSLEIEVLYFLSIVNYSTENGIHNVKICQ